jgi:hypothetical protein
VWEQVDDVSQYIPPAKPWMIKVRSNEEFKADLDDLVRLWKMFAEERGDDAAQIDLSYVIRRLLALGVDGGFAEFGGQPKSEEDWGTIRSQIKKTVKQTKR